MTDKFFDMLYNLGGNHPASLFPVGEKITQGMFLYISLP